MRRLPALGSLRAFEAAARHASFKRAAAELGVTPTAISHQIRQLEAELGGPLFVRLTRSVALTAAGDTLYHPMRQAFDTMAEAIRAVKQRQIRTIATLSATTAFTGRLLVPGAARFRALNPGWDLRLDASDEPVDLEAGAADAAIRYGGERHPGLTAVPLMADRFAPVCSPHLGLKTIDGLADVALIHFDWRFASDRRTLPTWRRWVSSAGVSLDPDSGIALSDESAAIQATIAGQGVALLSLALVAPELASGALIQPFGPVLEGRRYDLVFPQGAESRPAVVAIRLWLAEWLGPDSA
jgi:LysR family glycine cleavage system transcriptional activator